MHHDEILALYDRQLRINMPVPDARFRLERTDQVVRLVGPSTAEHDNCIVYSRLAAETADTFIRREIDYFAAAGRAFEWKVHGHDPPANLAERLIRHGLTADMPETVIVRDLAKTPGRQPAAAAIDVRRVVGRSQMADLVAVQDQVWGEDHAWFGDILARELDADAALIEILVAYAQALPVATSLMRLHRGTSFGSLWAASTLPDFRGRGIYSTLVERHAAAARATGLRFLTVDANENSRPVLERIGFRPLVTVQGYVWRPAG